MSILDKFDHIEWRANEEMTGIIFVDENDNELQFTNEEMEEVNKLMLEQFVHDNIPGNVRLKEFEKYCKNNPDAGKSVSFVVPPYKEKND
jgi:hypothetical protein